MKPYQQQFIQLCLQYRVLQFSEFTLKSGRKSPYFFNLGNFNSGQSLLQVGECYAQCILEHGQQYEVLFGPAYKGIPLVSSIAIALSRRGHEVSYAYNRKEVKTHGEGGSIVGANVKNAQVLIIDDVITAGTAVKESLELLEREQAKPVGVMLGLDRQEKGIDGSLSATRALQKNYLLPVNSIIGLEDLIQYIKLTRYGGDEHEVLLQRFHQYRENFGVG